MHYFSAHFIRAYEKFSQFHLFTRVLFTYVNQFIRIIQFFLKIYFYIRMVVRVNAVYMLTK